VLSRPPLLTRELTSFEKAYFLYQKRLNERLALPFSRYFYYKKGTPGDEEWKRKIRARKSAARDIGVYAAYGEEGWNDEVLVGDQTAEPENAVEALIRDAEGKNIVDDTAVGDTDKDGEAVTGEARVGEGQRRELQRVEVERPVPRVTEADRTNDLKSLSRKLDRSLYLLVKNKDGRWRFPEDRVYGRENLHQVRLLAFCPTVHALLNTDILPGRRTHPHPIRRHQHEHLDRRQPPRRPPHPLLPAWLQINTRCQPPRADFYPSTRWRGRCGERRARREGVLHEGQDHGRPGRSGEERVRRSGVQVVGEGGGAEGGYARVLEQC